MCPALSLAQYVYPYNRTALPWLKRHLANSAVGTAIATGQGIQLTWHRLWDICLWLTDRNRAHISQPQGNRSKGSSFWNLLAARKTKPSVCKCTTQGHRASQCVGQVHQCSTYYLNYWMPPSVWKDSDWVSGETFSFPDDPLYSFIDF